MAHPISSLRIQGTEAMLRVRVEREKNLSIPTLQASPPFPSSGPCLLLFLSNLALRWLGQIWPVILSLNQNLELAVWVWILSGPVSRPPFLHVGNEKMCREQFALLLCGWKGPYGEKGWRNASWLDGTFSEGTDPHFLPCSARPSMHSGPQFELGGSILELMERVWGAGLWWYPVCATEQATVLPGPQFSPLQNGCSDSISECQMLDWASYGLFFFFPF